VVDIGAGANVNEQFTNLTCANLGGDRSPASAILVREKMLTITRVVNLGGGFVKQKPPIGPRERTCN